MYLTAHRVARMRSPENLPYSRADTSVHGFLYRHGDDFKVETADLDEVTTRNPNGEFVDKLTPGLSQGGNAVLSYLDIVAADRIKGQRELLVRHLDSFANTIESARELPCATDEPGVVYIKYHISPRSYRDRADWAQDYSELKECALELFERWTEEE